MPQTKPQSKSAPKENTVDQQRHLQRELKDMPWHKNDPEPMLLRNFKGGLPEAQQRQRQARRVAELDSLYMNDKDFRDEARFLKTSDSLMEQQNRNK